MTRAWRKSLPMRYREPGRLRWRLAELLEDAGYKISPYELYPAQGYHRQKRSDCYSWEGFGELNGVTVWFTSWDTMTECVRFGIHIEPDGSPTNLLVSARALLHKEDER